VDNIAGRDKINSMRFKRSSY